MVIGHRFPISSHVIFIDGYFWDFSQDRQNIFFANGFCDKLLVAIFYFSQFLLPLPWQFSWYEGVRLTILHSFPFLVDIVRWFFARDHNIRATSEAIKDLPPNFTKYHAGIIRSHQTPVIFRGASFERGARPGFLRLQNFETVNQVIDLRRHLCSMPVQVLTRDGITLKSSVSTIFHVKRREDSVNDSWQFSVDQEDIFKVNYLGHFVSDNHKLLSWSEHICRQAVSAVIGEVSRYSLDELFEPDESRVIPLEKIKAKVTKLMVRAFEKYGIEILLVGISPFQVPQIVREQRIANWKAQWEQRIKFEQGAAQSERARRLKLARARAQIEIIDRLTEDIEVMNQKDEDIAEILALRLIEAIEEAESDATVRALIPNQVVRDLDFIRSHVFEETV